MEAKFLDLVHDVLNDKHNLGLMPEAALIINDQKIIFDLADRSKNVYVDVKSDFESRRRGDLATQLINKYSAIKRISNGARFFLVIENELSHSDRKFFIERFQNVTQERFEILDKNQIYSLAKEQDKINDQDIEIMNSPLKEKGSTINVNEEGIVMAYRELILDGLKRNWFARIDLKVLLSNPFKFDPVSTVEQAKFNEGLSRIEYNFKPLDKDIQEKVLFFLNQFVVDLIRSDSEIPRQNGIPANEVEKAFANSERRYFLAGSVWGTVDQAQRFFEEGVWEDAREDVSTEIVEGVNRGDVIFLKSTYTTKGVSYLRIKGVGKVIDNPGNGTDLQVEWGIQDIEIDIEGLGKYRRTFARVMPDDIEEILFSIGKEEIFNAGILVPVLPIDIEDNNKKQIGKRFLSSSGFAIQNIVEPVLGVKSIAREIADLIRNLKTNDLGKMIGVFGNWGRGKTFMVEQIWKELKVEDETSGPFIRVNFHAWKYQDTDASWAYLYEAFAKKYFEKDKNPLKRKLNDFRKRIRLNWKRHGAWPILKLTPSLLLITLGIYFDFQYGKEFTGKTFWSIFLTVLGIAGAVPVVIKYLNEYKLKEKASEVFHKYFNKPSFKDLLGIQSEIQEELRHLLECWLPITEGKEPEKHIILFVDDIDRCSEERIVQLIDALRVMLEDEEISKRVIVIAAVDERMLKRAIKWKYKELLDADRKLDGNIGDWESTTLQITSEYMDKLFLSGIKLGTLTSKERIDIYSEFSKGKVDEEKQLELQNEPEVIVLPITSTGTGTSESTRIDSSELNVPQPRKKTVTDLDRDLKFMVGSQKKVPILDEGNGKSEQEKLRINFEISSDENELLIQLISDLTDATPRQIRIFYYRYMLARNLLTAALIEGKFGNRFDTDVRNQLLARLLMHYTSLRSNAELIDDRRELLKKEMLKEVTSSKYIAGVEDALIAEVMDVLEMVIAY